MTNSRSNVVALPGNTMLRQEALPELTTVRDAIKGPVRLGFAVIVVFVLGGLAWSLLVPIAAGAVAPGIISPDGSRRTVQHLEGGIIHALKVRDGDFVRAGDPLLMLESTQAAAANEQLLEQSRTLAATRVRLLAEQAGSDALHFPDEMLARDDAGLREVIQGQISIFEMRRASLAAQLQVLDDREKQFQEQISALEAQVQGADRQLELIAEDLAAKEKLLGRALVTKPEILTLRRFEAALQGDRGEYLGEIAETQQKIGEIATQRISLRATRAEEVSTELEKVRAEMAGVSERLSASQDILDRTTVTAPVSGKVVNLHFKSIGGVILRGEPILDIVPTEERLLIDARIAPGDIDVVTVGLTATVHLTAFSSRGLPRVQGVVRSVSADRIVDEKTGQAYYLARVEVPREELAALDKGMVLVPGMPAEVLIVTAEQTAFDYMVEPFRAAFRRGFRES
ncbi:HlyD family type I secretion periplasmic adaptor subunit [Rhizobium sp. P32RR-XVIII]|uniref:HlyD family type I secretion periplasmic adaptor subunit n=1 Tax=Rhizobium sp. P32RR-XVIII TaxID=2726738 RepID=UPI0028B1601D|nr:HlyD family type I secretion periplasmic adaptor subunit [Rhizobium sp. P32RR-XVIII]